MAKNTSSTTKASSGKSTTRSTPKVVKDSKTSAATRTTAGSALSQKSASEKSTGGVVAYTKGSRFTDSEVRAAVRQVLDEGKGAKGI